MKPEALIVDFDGTLTRYDLLDYLADIVGQGDPSRQIRRAFQSGSIDGHTALIRRVKLLQGLSVNDIHGHLSLDLLLDGHSDFHNWIKQQTFAVVIASGNICPVISYYQDYINSQAQFCTRPDLVNGYITSLKAENIGKKVKHILDYLKAQNIDPTEVIAIGDDFSDIPFFKAVGSSIAFNPTHPDVSQAAAYSLTGNLTSLTNFLMNLLRDA